MVHAAFSRRSLTRTAATFALLVAGVGGAVSLAPSPGVAAVTSSPFLAHQAVYDLSLLRSRRAPSIDGARGRIVYDFSGNACEGYNTQFRQVSEINIGEGRTTLSDMRSTSWEAGDGKSYRFRIETRSNDKDAEVVDGMAERTASGVTVKLQKPSVKTVDLGPDVVFPTEQVERIVAAAREGKSLLELAVYDGSDTGEKVYNTFTVIGQPIPADRAPEKPDVATGNDALKTATRWPITVSYFDRAAAAKAGDQTPAYAMSFELYDNGVSRALVLDYNDFVVSGGISKFTARNTKPCTP